MSVSVLVSDLVFVLISVLVKILVFGLVLLLVLVLVSVLVSLVSVSVKGLGLVLVWVSELLFGFCFEFGLLRLSVSVSAQTKPNFVISVSI